MKVQSKLGVTIPTNCSCNCWASIKQDTDGDPTVLYQEGCDDYEWAWFKYDGVGNFPQIAGTENDLTYTPTDPSELVFVSFTSPTCCLAISNVLWINT